MRTIGKLTLAVMISIVVAVMIMYGFYVVAPCGNKDTLPLLYKWILVWIAIIGYRHAMNAIDASK